jgi:hypothetical protein
MEGFIDFLRHHLLTCPSKHIFHFDCPGCGMQRSVVYLLEGDLAKSFQMYPATIPILFCLIFTALHLKFKFKYGPEIIKGTFAFSALIIVIFYIYKLFTHQLF